MNSSEIVQQNLSKTIKFIALFIFVMVMIGVTIYDFNYSSQSESLIIDAFLSIPYVIFFVWAGIVYTKHLSKTFQQNRFKDAKSFVCFIVAMVMAGGIIYTIIYPHSPEALVIEDISSTVNLFLFVWGAVAYKKISRLVKVAQESEKEIITQFERRSKVLENLNAIVQKNLENKDSFLTKTIELRKMADDPNLSEEQAYNVETQLSELINNGHLINSIDTMVKEHPELETQTNILQFQEEIVLIENKLISLKQSFNNSIEQYFISLNNFPEVIIYKLFPSLNIDFQYWNLPSEKSYNINHTLLKNEQNIQGA